MTQILLKNIAEVTTEKRLTLGITDEILLNFDSTFVSDLFGTIEFKQEFLYIDESPLSWSHPIVYFDSNNHFEHRFTAFQGDWSDESQFRRFIASYADFLTNPSNIPFS